MPGASAFSVRLRAGDAEHAVELAIPAGEPIRVIDGWLEFDLPPDRRAYVLSEGARGVRGMPRRSALPPDTHRVAGRAGVEGSGTVALWLLGFDAHERVDELRTRLHGGPFQLDGAGTGGLERVVVGLRLSGRGRVRFGPPPKPGEREDPAPMPVRRRGAFEIAARMPLDELALPARTPDFLHHFEPHPGAEHLVIAFAGLATDPARPRAGWPLRMRLAGLPVHRLHVQSQIRPLPERCFDPPALNRFVAAACEVIGVPRERTVSCGSSLGATAAVEIGMRQGFAAVVAASPIILLADYLRLEMVPRAAREAIRRSYDGTDGLDRVITDAIVAAAGPTLLDFFVGDEDELYPAHADAAARACEANPEVTMRLTVHPGLDHAAIYRPFSRHLGAVLRDVLQLSSHAGDAACSSTSDGCSSATAS